MSFLANIQRGRAPMPPRIMLYGVEGIGKSTFAAEAPKPIFVQTEDGLAQIDCDKFPLATTFEEVQQRQRRPAQSAFGDRRPLQEAPGHRRDHQRDQGLHQEGVAHTAGRTGHGQHDAALEETGLMEFVLPYPPSINHYWRRVGPRTLISREGRRFRERVTAILAELRVQPLTGRLAVRVEVYPPDNRRRDIDNVQKALLDAMQHGGAYADDSQIVRLTIEKCEPVEGGRTIVRIERAE